MRERERERERDGEGERERERDGRRGRERGRGRGKAEQRERGAWSQAREGGREGMPRSLLFLAICAGTCSFAFRNHLSFEMYYHSVHDRKCSGSCQSQMIRWGPARLER